MIQLIEQIFLDTDFVIDDRISTNPNGHYKSLFAKRIKNDKFDFYLILSIDEESLDLGQVEQITNELLEQILENQKHPGVDKNLSLLLIVERKVIPYTDEFNRKVYDFEEDPFHFKKYILPFTTDQLDLLKKILSSRERIVEQLDTIVSQKHWFSIFKEDGKIDESEEAKVYDLVSKIYIKIPFMKLKVNKGELPNISKEIEDAITVDDKEVVHRILGMENKDLEWEEIIKVLGVELDEL